MGCFGKKKEKEKENKIVKPLKKPPDTPLAQQRLPSIQPIISTWWAIIIFAVIGVIFLPIGIGCLVTSANIQEFRIRYDGVCEEAFQQNVDPFGVPYCVRAIDFTVPKKINSNVYMYYELTTYFQNNREFAASRSDIQLAGGNPKWNTVDDCKPFRWFGENCGVAKASNQIMMNPCGQIAHAMFNDSFIITRLSDNQVICDTENPDDVLCTRRGLVFDSAIFKKYSQDIKYMAAHYSFPNEYCNEQGHKLPNVTDEDFMSWMILSQTSPFRKFYRVLFTDLEPGVPYRLTTIQRYPVWQYDGEKYVVFTEMSWIGMKNDFIGTIYVIVGALCLIMAAAFGILQIFNPRERGDLTPFLRDLDD